jgi:nicotinamide riboside kinase
MSELLRELQSTVCRCGRVKRARQTFCAECYRALSRKLQVGLYRRFGSGYEESYAAAIAELRGDVREPGDDE